VKRIKILYGLEAADGGALKHLVYLVTRLDKPLFDITVIISKLRSWNIQEEIEKMKIAGAEIVYLPMERNIHIIKDLLVIIKLFIYIRRKKYYIVHAHSSKAGGVFRIAAWLNKVPRIYYTPHCFYFQGKYGIKKKIYILLEKILCRISTGIIVSENEQDELVKNKICSYAKIFNINNAIDFNEYEHLQEVKKIRQELRIPSSHFVIGAIGRLVTQKDWKTYILAAKEVIKDYNNVTFLMVGEGELRNKLQCFINELELQKRIIIVGYIKEIYKIYSIIDVLVNTSLWEGLPFTFLEAMAYKKPIIATATGNETTILDEETGFISPQKDYETIADKIKQLIDDKELANTMGNKGNEWFHKKYSFEFFISQHTKLYKK